MVRVNGLVRINGTGERYAKGVTAGEIPEFHNGELVR